jgi:hypothetical protein
VNGHREVARLCQRELGPEHGLLHLAWREVVVVVEPDLANRPHAGPAVQAARQQRRRRRRVTGEQVCVMRVHAGGELDAVPGRGQRPGALPLRIVFGGDDDEQLLEPGRPRAGDHGLEIGDELLAG